MSERDELFAPGRTDGLDDELDDDLAVLTDDGDGLPDEVRAELEAVATLEAQAAEAASAVEREAERVLAAVQAELDAQRAATRSAMARYREALLAAEPDLPPDLVGGETLEVLDASVTVARETVARIRARLVASAPPPGSPPRGFPVGAPARGTFSRGGLTSAEKIAVGLGERR